MASLYCRALVEKTKLYVKMNTLVKMMVSGDLGFIFTSFKVNMNLIRYRHTRLDSIGADEFRFVLTDGMVESKEELFNIEISGQSSGEIHFHSVPIEVREGKDCLFPVLTIVPNQTTKEISII